MSEEDEATTGARTPWRLWAGGVGCPRLEGGPRAASSLPLPVHAERGRYNPGAPKLTMSHQFR